MCSSTVCCCSAAAVSVYCGSELGRSSGDGNGLDRPDGQRVVALVSVIWVREIVIFVFSFTLFMVVVAVN